MNQQLENINDARIAWLIPSLAGGNYWHPIFCRFFTIFKQTIVYTGVWPGFSCGFENTFKIQVVGHTKFVSTTQSQTGYTRGFINVSPLIITHLITFKTQLIFASGFSLWTILSVLFKPLGKWRIVIVYEGSTPNVDYRDSIIRTWLRRLIAKSGDAFITNTLAGKKYLIEVLQANEDKVFARPYEVPDFNALCKLDKKYQLSNEIAPQQIKFLFIGQLIQRKGIEYLLQACKILQSWGYETYELIVIGIGSQQEELATYSQQHSLNVKWIGSVDYSSLGFYFQNADVFVLPSLEDTWGMVVLESMLFGKPVLCSRWAGASEMIVDGANGYLFEPKEPEELAKIMGHLINHPDLIASMGAESQRLIAKHTPETAVQFLVEVTDKALKNNLVQEKT
jgi:glycosyltransferase involved in cell wall biosynthesis